MMMSKNNASMGAGGLQNGDSTNPGASGQTSSNGDIAHISAQTIPSGNNPHNGSYSLGVIQEHPYLYNNSELSSSTHSSVNDLDVELNTLRSQGKLPVAIDQRTGRQSRASGTNSATGGERQSAQIRAEFDSSFYQLGSSIGTGSYSGVPSTNSADTYGTNRPISSAISSPVQSRPASSVTNTTNNSSATQPQTTTEATSTTTTTATMPADRFFALNLRQLVDVGFPEEYSAIALKRCNNNVEEAITFCLEHDDDAMQAYILEDRAATAMRNRVANNNSRTAGTQQTGGQGGLARPQGPQVGMQRRESKSVFKRMLGLKSKHAVPAPPVSVPTSGPGTTASSTPNATVNTSATGASSSSHQSNLASAISLQQSSTATTATTSISSTTTSTGMAQSSRPPALESPSAFMLDLNSASSAMEALSSGPTPPPTMNPNYHQPQPTFGEFRGLGLGDDAVLEAVLAESALLSGMQRASPTPAQTATLSSSSSPSSTASPSAAVTINSHPGSSASNNGFKPPPPPVSVKPKSAEESMEAAIASATAAVMRKRDAVLAADSSRQASAATSPAAAVTTSAPDAYAAFDFLTPTTTAAVMGPVRTVSPTPPPKPPRPSSAASSMMPVTVAISEVVSTPVSPVATVLEESVAAVEAESSSEPLVSDPVNLLSTDEAAEESEEPSPAVEVSEPRQEPTQEPAPPAEYDLLEFGYSFSPQAAVQQAAQVREAPQAPPVTSMLRTATSERCAFDAFDEIVNEPSPVSEAADSEVASEGQVSSESDRSEAMVEPAVVADGMVSITVVEPGSEQSPAAVIVDLALVDASFVPQSATSSCSGDATTIEERETEEVETEGEESPCSRVGGIALLFPNDVMMEPVTESQVVAPVVVDTVAAGDAAVEVTVSSPLQLDLSCLPSIEESAEASIEPTTEEINTAQILTVTENQPSVETVESRAEEGRPEGSENDVVAAVDGEVPVPSEAVDSETTATAGVAGANAGHEGVGSIPLGNTKKSRQNLLAEIDMIVGRSDQEGGAVAGSRLSGGNTVFVLPAVAAVGTAAVAGTATAAAVLSNSFASSSVEPSDELSTATVVSGETAQEAVDSESVDTPAEMISVDDCFCPLPEDAFEPSAAVIAADAAASGVEGDITEVDNPVSGALSRPMSDALSVGSRPISTISASVFLAAASAPPPTQSILNIDTSGGFLDNGEQGEEENGNDLMNVENHTNSENRNTAVMSGNGTQHTMGDVAFTANLLDFEFDDNSNNNNGVGDDEDDEEETQRESDVFDYHHQRLHSEDSMLDSSVAAAAEMTSNAHGGSSSSSTSSSGASQSDRIDMLGMVANPGTSSSSLSSWTDSQQHQQQQQHITSLYREVQAHLTTVVKRKHLPITVNQSTLTSFSAQISLSQFLLKKNERSPQGNRPNTVSIGACSTRELATDLCLTLAPPIWAGKKECPQCIHCNKVFTMFKKGHHCRNCGYIVCNKCSDKSWPSTMVPSTYHDNEKFIRVCVSCQTSTELFTKALRRGDYNSALNLYNNCNVNLHCPISIYVSNAYPVHCAAGGGNLQLLKWLIEEKKCSIRDNGTKTPLLTGKNLSVLAVAAQAGHVNIMRYLVHNRRCDVLEITEMSILHRALHMALEAPGPMPPYIRAKKEKDKNAEMLGHTAEVDRSNPTTITYTDTATAAGGHAASSSSSSSSSSSAIATAGIATTSNEAGMSLRSPNLIHNLSPSAVGVTSVVSPQSLQTRGGQQSERPRGAPRERPPPLMVQIQQQRANQARNQAPAVPAIPPPPAQSSVYLPAQHQSSGQRVGEAQSRAPTATTTTSTAQAQAQAEAQGQGGRVTSPAGTPQTSSPPESRSVIIQRDREAQRQAARESQSLVDNIQARVDARTNMTLPPPSPGMNRRGQSEESRSSRQPSYVRSSAGSQQTTPTASAPPVNRPFYVGPGTSQNSLSNITSEQREGLTTASLPSATFASAPLTSPIMAPPAAVSGGGSSSSTMRVPASRVAQPRALYNEAPVSIATAEVVRADIYTAPTRTDSPATRNNNSRNAAVAATASIASSDEPVAATAFLASDLIFEVGDFMHIDSNSNISLSNNTSNNDIGRFSPTRSELGGRDLSVRYIAVASPYIHTPVTSSASAARASPNALGQTASASAVAAAIAARTLPELVVEGQANRNNNNNNANRSGRTAAWF